MAPKRKKPATKKAKNVQEVDSGSQPPTKRKRSGKKIDPDTMDVDDPGTADSQMTVPTRSMRTRKALPTAPRDPLPARDGRNSHPGLIVAPRSKRTSGQVAAEKVAKDNAWLAAEATHAANMTQLSEMFAAEETGREMEENLIPTQKPRENEPSGLDIEAESEDEEPSKVKTGRKKKPVKGETRALVEGVEKALEIERLESRLEALRRGETKATIDNVVEAKKKPSRVVPPTGLLPSFKPRLSTAPPKELKRQTSKTSSRTSVLSKTSQEDGGLQEIDIQDLRPHSKSQVATGSLVENVEDGGDQFLALCEEHDLSGIDSPDSSDDESDHLPTQLQFSNVSATVVKTPVSSATVHKAPKGKTASSRTPTSIPSTPNVSDEPLSLPTWAVRKWRDTKLTEIIQEVVDAVYIDEEYTVDGSKDDAIYHIAYDRVREKISGIGRYTLTLVKQHFEQQYYKNKPTRIRKYAKWAMKPNGPGICEEPAPQPLSSLSSSDPLYQKARGICLSPFMVDTMKEFIRHGAGSVEYHGNFIGLVALSAAAVTRAFRMYSIDGIFTKSAGSDFAEVYWNDVVLSFIASAKTFSRNQWQRIRDKLGVAEGESDLGHPIQPKVEVSFYDTVAELYTPSSP
ncbi:hypothetical protein E1B28_009164 [Marasmius oreades]|uniref:Uncharacterized protein n=1 Tax=Marasmius oreades TaxID=181124 RepID=A0A9P7S032_9AGAR|nr:uncharacterized protein E1B28_009164 [Marasmius oreades]KAG7092850.1 hypothetical protein E1B28_009164 [Marasmius oreades]